MAKDTRGDERNETRIVAFEYIKSNLFRVVHADGAIGGPTPRGFIEINFYSERSPIPRRIAHSLESNGKLGAEIATERVTRDAVIREVEVGVLVDLATAKAVNDWLGKKIQEIETAIAANTQGS